MTALFKSTPLPIKPEWIDYNGHLNMAYYAVLFDQGTEQHSELLGLGPRYAETRGHTTYTAELHIRYLRELHLGDEVEVTVQILDHDAKRLHTFHELRHVDGWLSATAECMTLHVDMSGPKVAPFPEDIAERVSEAAKAHAALPRPAGAGRRIEISRR